MKCEYCNADLSIEHANCPFCGNPNPYYQLHRKEMLEYEQEFTQTKQNVYRETKRFTKMTVHITVIAVLVALNLLFLLGHLVFADTIIYERESSRISKQADEIRIRLEEMERDGDYIGIAEFCNTNRVWTAEELDDFSQVRIVCGNYQYIYENVMRQFCGRDSDRAQKLDWRVELIESSLQNVYQAMDPEQSYGIEAGYEGIHKETMEQCLEQIEALLYTYCNISRENLENFPKMSAAQRSMIIEEGLQSYEKEE